MSRFRVVAIVSSAGLGTVLTHILESGHELLECQLVPKEVKTSPKKEVKEKLPRGAIAQRVEELLLPMMPPSTGPLIQRIQLIEQLAFHKITVSQIDAALHALNKRGVIRRVAPGMYSLPEVTA